MHRYTPVLFVSLVSIAMFSCSALLAGTTLSSVAQNPAGPNPYTTEGATHTNVGALQVRTLDGIFGCSATLIDPSWILTAGHCADGATGDNTTFSLDAKVGTVDESFYLGSDEALSFNVDQVVPHPKWDGNLGRGYDIALMRLKDPVPAAITPASLYSGSGERNQDVTIVGYGMYGDDITGIVGTDGYKRAGTNVVDNFFRTGGKTQRLLAIDFDNGSESAFGSTTPTSMELFTVYGDSGGGVFIGNELAGVNSFLADANGDDIIGNAGDYSGHTRVSSHLNFISNTLGGGGVVEEPDDGGGSQGRPPGRGRRSTLATPIALRAVASVPEPSTLSLLILGALFAASGCRKRR